MHRLDFKELARCIHSLYDADEAIDPKESVLDVSILDAHRQNAVNAVTNDAHRLSAECMKLHLFVFPHTKRNQRLYGDTSSGVHNKMYLIVEERTGYTASNCNRLYLESCLLRGVDEHDVRERTPLYLDYQCCRTWYEERYGKDALDILRTNRTPHHL